MAMDEVLVAGDVRMFSVVFEAGAHTHWHTHTQGQLLIVAHGCGVVATRAGESQLLLPGDVVYAPAGEEHWHGAAPDSFVAYTAISFGATEPTTTLDSDGYLSCCQRATAIPR